MNGVTTQGFDHSRTTHLSFGASCTLTIFPPLLLQLNFCGVGSDGMAALAPVLVANTQLASLNLDTNSLCETGTASLASSLCGTSGLTSLDLGCNYMKSRGLEGLAGVLMVNSSMRALRLGCNDVGKRNDCKHPQGVPGG